jgi:LacI family transcriptional regulator
MITLKQIAKKCGVSTASVSIALTMQTDISVDTANRIREVAKREGYYPNSAASP